MIKELIVGLAAATIIGCGGKSIENVVVTPDVGEVVLSIPIPKERNYSELALLRNWGNGSGNYIGIGFDFDGDKVADMFELYRFTYNYKDGIQVFELVDRSFKDSIAEGLSGWVLKSNKNGGFD